MKVQSENNNISHLKLKSKISIIILFCSFLLSCTKGATGNEPDDISNTSKDSLIIDTPILSKDFSVALFFNFTQNHNQPDEGFAVYGNYAFALFAKGVCDIYDLNTKKFVNGFNLGSYSSSNHANVADFGVEFPEGNSDFPAFYVSECTGEKRCFVEDISLTGSKLIQTISLSSKKSGKGWTDWAVDRDNQLLYCLTEISGTGDTNYNILVFNLPKLSESNVKFTDDDLLDNWSIEEKGTTQGLFVRNGYMYFPMSSGSGLTGCVLYIMDLKNQNHEISTINLGSNFTNRECEDLYLYKNYFLINFQRSGVYSFINKK